MSEKQDTLRGIITDLISEGYETWRRPRAQRVIQTIQENCRQIHDKRIFIEVLGVLTSAPISGTTLLKHYNPSNHHTDQRRFCLPRLGAVEFINALKENNSVALVSDPLEGLIGELVESFGLTYAAGSQPINPTQLKDHLVGHDKSTNLVFCRNDSGIGNSSLCDSLSSEPWDPTGGVGMHMWAQNDGLVHLSRKERRPMRLPLAS